ncbi:MAG TPA: glycosyltransferase family 2 protein [Chitinivibrionales bacterium]|nr:glycosyltransferase family 2 protein [Chitinivibrionales bacterium]
MSKIAVIIPAKNEAQNIGRVIEDVRSNAPQCDIIVVDDHSADNTVQTAEMFERVTVLSSSISLGIGGAVQLGVLYALKQGYDTLVRMDGDGQHNGFFIDKLLSKVKDNVLVVGTRCGADFKTSSDMARKIGGWYFRLLFRFFTRTNVLDPTSGFICFGKSIAEKFARYYPLDYPEIESTMLLIRAGYRIECEEVRMNPRKQGRSSISWFYSLVYMIAVSLAFFISFFKDNPYKGQSWKSP